MNKKSSVLLNNTCISQVYKKPSPKKIIISIIILSLFLLILYFISPFILSSLGKNLICTKPTNKADMIVVLSGGEDNRIIMAVDLYKKGISRKIMMSGGGPFLGSYYAKFMGDYAHELGVKKRNILYELNSLSTFENAKFSYPILKKRGVKSILIVTSKYHTKRAYKVFRKFYPDIDVYIIGAPDGINYKNWWHNYEMSDKILHEFVKTIIYFFK
ncbi:MAG: YdcF family protein [Candidatus Margulisiibacteriota bacterium]|jgi:uncharacterized SAM-binding protein YcdF (DUF218 family)